jgi:hypothetical protein
VIFGTEVAILDEEELYELILLELPEDICPGHDPMLSVGTFSPELFSF